MCKKHKRRRAAKRRPGARAPPFHVFCRSTTVPYFAEDFGDIGERAARDGESGKTYYVPADMTYREWEKKFILGGDKSDLDTEDDGKTLRYRRKKHGYDDITDSWYPNAKPGSHVVEDADEVTVNGITYKVDGRNVQLSYSPHEKEIAELLEREVGGELKMLPRVNFPAGVRTPDYLFNGEGYDLKTLKGKIVSGNDRIFNRVKKGKGQAQNFIIDISNADIGDEIIEKQLKKIYESLETMFVDKVAIIRNGKIVKVVRRKR